MQTPLLPAPLNISTVMCLHTYHTKIYVHTHTHTHTHTRVHTHAHTHTHTHTHTRTRTHIYMYTGTCIRGCIHIYIYIYISISIYIYLYIYACIYILQMYTPFLSSQTNRMPCFAVFVPQIATNAHGHKKIGFFGHCYHSFFDS